MENDGTLTRDHTVAGALQPADREHDREVIPPFARTSEASARSSTFIIKPGINARGFIRTGPAGAVRTGDRGRSGYLRRGGRECSKSSRPMPSRRGCVIVPGDARPIRWMCAHPPSRDALPMDHTSRYEIHIGDLLGERLLTAFPELPARTLESVTPLVGDLPDEGALHGVLARIEPLGFDLLEVRRGKSVATGWVRPGRGSA